MAEVTGLVTKLNKKTQTAAGRPMKSPAYSILLDDSVWYNFGFDSPTCSEGDVITFQASQDNYGSVGKFSTVTVEVGGAKTAPKAAAAVQKADTRQESIVYQSSLKTAVEVLDLAIRNECVTLPSKKADRLNALELMLHEIATGIARVAIDPHFNEESEPVVDDE